MQPQLDVKILSSFLIHLDHTIQADGLAYRNQVVQFFPTHSPFSSGTYVYTTPIKPLVNDISIPGANVMSGVWLGPSYIQVGESGLHAINHYKGAVYFTGTRPPNVPMSGNAAIKEVSVKITDKQDWKLMFETQYVNADAKITPSGTGLAIDTEVSPIVFIRFKGSENKPFGFSKLDNQTIYVRSVVVADNEYQKISLLSILKNFNLHTIPIVLSTPFNAVGDMTGINYNYSQLSYDQNFTPLVWSVKTIDVPIQGEYRNILRNMAIVDFELSTIARS